MTAASRDLIAAFDALPPDEQRQVAAVILRRAASEGDIPEEALTELAAELFRAYDAEEAAVKTRGKRGSRKKFEAALNAVPDVEPPESDRLPRKKKRSRAK